MAKEKNMAVSVTNLTKELDLRSIEKQKLLYTFLGICEDWNADPRNIAAAGLSLAMIASLDDLLTDRNVFLKVAMQFLEDVNHHRDIVKIIKKIKS